MPRLLAPLPGRPLARLALSVAAPAAALALAAAPQPAAAQGIAGPYLAGHHAAVRGDILEAARYFSEAQTRDRENLQLLERTVLHQVAAGRIGTAVALARQLREAEPGHHLAVLVLAADGLRRGDPAAVAELIATVEDEAPFVARVIEAWAEFGTGDTAAARGILESVAEQALGGPAGQMVATYHQGLLAVAAGDDAAAVESFAEAAELAGMPTLLMVRHHAEALARLGRFDEAGALVRERLSNLLGDERLERLAAALADGRAPEPAVARASEGAAEALFALSGFLSRAPSPVVAIAYSRLAAWIDPELVEAKLLIAEMLAEQGQHQLAIDAYAAIPGDAPEALEAMMGRARAMEEAGDIELALETLRETVERFPEELEAHTALGDMLRRAERFAESASIYDDALALVDAEQSRFWPLFYQRGIAHERSGHWEQAEADLRKALALEPDQPLVLNYLGYSLVELGENLDEAEGMIEKAVEQRPEDGYIIDSLGWVQFRLGEFDAAVENLQRAVELRPVDPILNDHFGDALWMVGRRTEARFQWKRALSFEPEEEDAERIRRKLEVGLDTVLAEEAAEGKPTIVTREETTATRSNEGG